jgi:hypothetical protein
VLIILFDRKNEIDGILMDEISNQQSSNSPVKEEHTTQKPTSASSKFKTESKQPTVTQSKKTNSSAKASNGNTSNDEDSDFDLPDDVKADSDSDDQVHLVSLDDWKKNDLVAIN